MSAKAIDSGEQSGVDGTPTIFMNGRQYLEEYGPTALLAALIAVARSNAPRR